MSNTSRPIANTIKEQVYQILKKQICSGIYEPGKWLQENELANELKVSRSPVREALRQLASDGLVINIPNKGVFIKEITPKDIEDIFDLRVMLESYAIKRSSGYLTDEKEKVLLEYVYKLKQTHYENNLQLYTKLDAQLHNMIISLGGNSLVESTYEKVSSMTQQFRIYSLTGRQRFDESVREHRDIVHNILKGNTSEADRINKTHLKLARDKILEYMSSLEVKSESGLV